jgi:excisionase family DNA binding protein
MTGNPENLSMRGQLRKLLRIGGHYWSPGTPRTNDSLQQPTIDRPTIAINHRRQPGPAAASAAPRCAAGTPTRSTAHDPTEPKPAASGASSPENQSAHTKPLTSTSTAPESAQTEPEAMASAPSKTLLTAHDVASMLGVPVSWVYARSRTGEIPTVKLGRYYRYRLETIESWLGSREA